MDDSPLRLIKEYEKECFIEFIEITIKVKFYNVEL